MKKLAACNAELAEMVEHMTRLQPENRLSVDEYLHKWPKTVFPAFFRPLHDLLSPLMTWAQDHSVLLLKASFSGFLTRLKRKAEPQDDEQVHSGAPGDSDSITANQQSGVTSPPAFTRPPWSASQGASWGTTSAERGSEHVQLHKRSGSEPAGEIAQSRLFCHVAAGLWRRKMSNPQQLVPVVVCCIFPRIALNAFKAPKDHVMCQ